MRDYVPYAGEFGQYGADDEHTFFGPDQYKFNYSGQAPSAPNAPGAPGAPGALPNIGIDNDPSGMVGGPVSGPEVGMNAKSATLGDWLGHVASGVGLMTNPVIGFPTALASIAMNGKFTTSPIDLAMKTLTGKGVLSHIGDTLGFGEGQFTGPGGVNKDAPPTFGGVSRTDEQAYSDMMGGGEGTNTVGSNSDFGPDGGDMYAEGGRVNAFLGGFFDDLISGIGGAVSGAGDFVSDAVSGVGDWLGSAGGNALSLFDDATSTSFGSDFMSGGGNDAALPSLGDPIEVATRSAPVSAIEPETLMAIASSDKSDAITSMLKELGISSAEKKPDWFSRNKWPLLAAAGVLGLNLANRQKALPKSVLQGAQNNFTYGPSLPQLPFNRRMTMPNRNPLTAGYGGEQSYFSENALPKATGGGVLGKVGAGSSSSKARYVKGPGDGRADKIPAYLSNDEYVIDAESVALLGNGSPEHGADKLDDMRARIRQHKGKALAKGKFSPAAKNPMEYMQ